LRDFPLEYAVAGALPSVCEGGAFCFSITRSNPHEEGRKQKDGIELDAGSRGSSRAATPPGCLLLYTLKELPQPQVLLTFGLLNLKPEPSRVSM
jgi:hypothetical protein